MKEINYGIYTIYNGVEMAISEYYGHGLNQGLSENYRSLSYPQKYGQFDGFTYDSVAKKFKMNILVKDLTNAFFIVTKATYKGKNFIVEPYYGDQIHLHLTTKNLSLGKELDFYELHNGYGEPYYLGEINISEIEKVWEERKQSEYNLPLPYGLETYKEILI